MNWFIDFVIDFYHKFDSPDAISDLENLFDEYVWSD